MQQLKELGINVKRKNLDKKRKLAFITGGTGSVGTELVRVFSAKGYRVFFQYNSDMQAARRLTMKYNAQPLQIDFAGVLDLPDIAFDIVVNNAGVNLTSALSHGVNDEDWEKTLRVNLYAPFCIARRYLPGMMRKKWGRIINISSIYGLRGSENNLPYNVSKHGLSGLTKTIAKEYGSYKVTCNEICPAAIESELMNRIASEESKSMRISMKEYFKSICEEIPARRMAKPKDIADVAVFLASDEAAFINGASITVDGGKIA